MAAPAPDHAIARGRAGAGLLAHIVVSKYDDHLPLYRQAEIFARDGMSLETSTLCGWVGATAATLQPLVDALAVEVLASDNLHVDDTPVPVLAPGTGKTKTGRLWTYVRDERPFGGSRKPAALFFYSPDRKGEHPQAHLKQFRGVIHTDGYAGFNELFAGGRIVEAGCWAHVRRAQRITSRCRSHYHTICGSLPVSPPHDKLRGGLIRGRLYLMEAYPEQARRPTVCSSCWNVRRGVYAASLFTLSEINVGAPASHGWSLEGIGLIGSRPAEE